jgi:hypothetical protein
VDSTSGVSPSLPIISISLDVDTPVFLLVDTGSSVSLLQEDLLPKSAKISPINACVTALNGSKVEIVGKSTIWIKYKNSFVDEFEFLITKTQMKNFHGILGDNFFRKHKVMIDYENQCIRVADKKSELAERGCKIPFIRYLHLASYGIQVKYPEDGQDQANPGPMPQMTIEVIVKPHGDVLPQNGGSTAYIHKSKDFEMPLRTLPSVKPQDEVLPQNVGSTAYVGKSKDFEKSQCKKPRIRGSEKPRFVERDIDTVQRFLPVSSDTVLPQKNESVKCSALLMDREVLVGRHVDEGVRRNTSAGCSDGHDITTDKVSAEAALAVHEECNVLKGIEGRMENSSSIRFYVARKIRVPRMSWGTIPVIFSGKEEINGQVNCLVERSEEPNDVIIGTTLLNLNAPKLFLPFVNVAENDIILTKKSPIAWGEKIDDSRRVMDNPSGEQKIGSINAMGHAKKGQGNESAQQEVVKFQDLIDKAIYKSECPESCQPELRKILTKYYGILADKNDAVGYCDLYQPTIPLDTEEPIYTPQYPIPQKMRQQMRETVEEFLRDGVVQHSRSPYNSPTIMVSKKDGGHRMCVDFRKLNSHVITDPHPLPRINQILEELGQSVYFTALDILSGFYNLRIAQSCREKTAFSTPDGHFEFNRLPMGLKNSPSIFQRLMNLVLAGTLGKYAFIYVDDIVIYSKNAEDHLKHLDIILSRLQETGFKVKFSKCQMFLSQIEYLGYLISRDGLRVNPNKVAAATNFPTPKDVKGVQGFLGLVGYFRWFIYNYAEKAKGLYDLLKSTTDFVWGEKQEESFSVLKKALQEAPVLAFPDFSKEFILTTDASGYAIGAILTQVQGQELKVIRYESKKLDKKYLGKERLITCHSRTLKDAETRYNNTDREILAVIYGVKQNRSCLWGNFFVIRTDHAAIPYLERNKSSDSSRAIRWFLQLAEYNYRVEHKSGRSIAHADALSRYPQENSQKALGATSNYCGITKPFPEFSDDVTSRIDDAPLTQSTNVCSTGCNNVAPITQSPVVERNASSNNVCQTSNLDHEEIIAYLSPALQDPNPVPYISTEAWKDEIANLKKEELPLGDKYRMQNGLLFHFDSKLRRETLWVPRKFREVIMKLFHDPPSSGHAGVARMVQNLKSEVYWNSMEVDVRDFVRSCELCQKFKKSRTKSPMRSTPIPLNVFEDISVDVVGPVPYPSKGYHYILVTQDRLSRWISFEPMINATAETTVRTILVNWICVYGVPQRILTDRGSNFVSKLFDEMATFLGTKLNNTVAYRPQANGQNERSHQELHGYLSMYLSGSLSKQWHTMLKLASWMHNSSVHEALGMSPYEVVTGIKPQNAKAWLPTESGTFPETLRKFKEFYGVSKDRFDDIRKRARLAIEKAQARSLKRNFDHNKPVRFKRGQQVLVKIHTAKKWAPKFKGPFVVREVISPSVLLIFNPDTNQEDIVHSDYCKSYYTRDGSPRYVGTDIEETEVNDDFVEYTQEVTPNSQKIELIQDQDDSLEIQESPIIPQSPSIRKNIGRFARRMKNKIFNRTPERRVSFDDDPEINETKEDETFSTPSSIGPQQSPTSMRSSRIRKATRRLQVDPSKKSYDD